MQSQRFSPNYQLAKDYWLNAFFLKNIIADDLPETFV